MRTFSVKQRVHRTAALGSPTGLDSEEAALIHESYRKNLGGSEAKGSDRVLLLTGDGAGSQSN